MLTERFVCPLCRAPFGGDFVCPSGHRFDLAREGYIHLLPVQKKGSRDPGDNAAMIAARSAFLTAGYYQPLVDALIRALQPTAPLSALLDLGAGEGYYTGAVAAAFPAAAVYGIDISKAGIRAAARRYPRCRFAIASNRDLPVADGSFSHALNIFAPLVDAEVHRALRPGGYLLRVSPAPQHLYEIKALLYPEVRLHDPDTYQPQGFVSLSCTRLQQAFVLQDLAALQQLIQMTPYAWKLPHFDAESLGRALPLTVTLDVWIHTWKAKTP